MTKKRARSRKRQTRRRVDPLVIIGVVVALVVVAAAVWQIAGASRGVKRLTTEAQVQRLSPADAMAMINKGDAALYDVRSREAYAAKHAVGAQSLPESELESLVATLPQDKSLILY